MAMIKAHPTQPRNATPPTTTPRQPPTPPATGEKPAAGPHPVVALLRQRYQGLETAELRTRKAFALASGEYEQIKRELQRDPPLWAYVEDKVHYDYDSDQCAIVIRMPSEVHEAFIAAVDDEIHAQVKALRLNPGGQDGMARFAEKVRPFRSTDIYFASTTPSSKSKYCPDISYRHEDAKFPGVVIEVGYSQEKKSIRRKAESYILDSNANIRVVIGLDLAYSTESKKATVSIWRPRLFDTAEGRELGVVEEIADMAFRDNTGHFVPGADLQFNVSEFTQNELARKELEDQDRQVIISATQLCQYLKVAESSIGRALAESPLPADVKKRKRADTPPEEVDTADEKGFADEEERAVTRAAHGDSEYHDGSSADSSN